MALSTSAISILEGWAGKLFTSAIDVFELANGLRKLTYVFEPSITMLIYNYSIIIATVLFTRHCSILFYQTSQSWAPFQIASFLKKINLPHLSEPNLKEKWA